MRRILIMLLCIALLGTFAGCRAKTATEIETGSTVAQDQTAATEEYIPIDATVSNVGSDKFEGEFIEIKPQCPPSYGVSFWLPTGWTYSGMQSDDDPTSDLVVSIRPEFPGTEGAITLQHMKGFGVCGTGLEQKDIVFNGHEAWQGFYDGNTLWSHIILKDPKDCVIINNAENWYEEYEEEINQILSTVEFVYYETNTPIAESAEIIIDSASLDIDGDGIIEDCKIADGPTSVTATTKTVYAIYTENGPLFADCLNADLMTRSAVRHLPVYKLDTMEDLRSFRARFQSILTQYPGLENHPTFDEGTTAYDEEFFSRNTVVLAYVTAASGSYRFGIRNVTADGALCRLDIVQTNHPEVCTSNMGAWFVLAEIPDSEIAGCTQFDARLVE